MPAWIMALTTVVAAVTLAAGFAEKAPTLVGLAVASGALWVWAQRKRWTTVGSAVMAAFLAMAALGIHSGISPGLCLLAVIATVSAWDLEDWAAQASSISGGPEGGRLMRRYFFRLLTVDAVGAALGGLALVLRLDLDLGVAILVGLAAVWGLSQVVRFLNQESGSGSETNKP